MGLHSDFKIIAAKNPAAELLELNKKFFNCCTVKYGADREMLFDGFDIQDYAVQEFEAVARKYAEMENPGEDDGISYMRKGEEPTDAIVEYSNGLTEAHICLTLSAVGFMEE